MELLRDQKERTRGEAEIDLQMISEKTMIVILEAGVDSRSDKRLGSLLR